MGFKVSDLAGGIGISVDGVSLLRVTRQTPVANFSPDFRFFKLPKPMRLWEVSQRLYSDPAYWKFIADWNGIPRPARYFIEYLPLGNEIRYLAVEDFLAYQRRQKIFNLNGAGEIDFSDL